MCRLNSVTSLVGSVAVEKFIIELQTLGGSELYFFLLFKIVTSLTYI